MALLAILAGGCRLERPPERAAAGAVIHPAGCPVPPAAEIHDRSDGTPVAAAQPPDRTRTVAHHATGVRVDLPEAVRRIRRLLAGARLVAAHTLPASGIRVELYSDGPLTLDPTDLEDAFGAPFRAAATVEDRAFREVLGCYRDRIVGSRELEGTRVRLLVPSDPSVCLHRLVLGLDDPPDGTCRSGGVTLPAVDVSLGGIVELRGSPLIVLAPAAGQRDPPRPDRALTRVLVHEVVHLYDNAMGLFPRPGEMLAYEQRAHYAEARIVGWYRERDRPLPTPIRFPA